MRYCFILYVCILYYSPLLCFKSKAATDIPVIFLNENTRELNACQKALVFKDKSASLSLSRVMLMPDSFSLNRESVINAGSTSASMWIKLKLHNETSHEWFIDIGEPYIDYIDLYSLDAAGKVEHIKSGLRRKFDSSSIRVNHFILPLNIKPDEEKTYYIKARSYTVLKLPLVISTIQDHFEMNHREDIINGIYFGLVLSLSLYNLFVFLLLRDRTYLFYVLYINFLGATITWVRGYSPEFMNVLPPNINHGNVYAALTFMFLTLFTHSFLNLQKFAPGHTRLRAIAFMISAATIITTITGLYYISFLLVVFIVLINLPYITFFGLKAYLRQFKPAAYYLLGFACFTIGDMFFILSENAMIQSSVLGDYSLQIGSSLEAIILSFALANKLNMYKKEKEKSQANALAMATEFSKALIKTQEVERKRIAGELHDSVGQSLSLIKNRINIIKKSRAGESSLDELNDVVTNAIQEVRSITYALRPFQLDLLGLTQSLKSLTEDVSESTEIKFQVKIDNIDESFTKEDEINVFRIVQECLSNICRHSEATEAKVEIRNPSGKILIHIEDNGVGLSARVNGHGYGLIGIRERVSILKGTMNILSNQPSGTCIEIQL